METVRSKDDTSIAYQRSGKGPPLVLVHGTTGNHLSFRVVQPLLEEHFTVYAIDRRGRGQSGDTPEHAIERMEELIRRGERDQAVTLMFREVLELSKEELAQFRASPTWPMRVAAAHTIPRELRAEEGYRPDPEQFRSVTMPALLVLGSESPAWAHQGTELARAVLPAARVTVLPRQGYLAIMTAPELFTTEVVRFLQAQ